MEGKKYDDGKPRVDLIDPDFILGIAEVLTHGAKKYKENSWKYVPNGTRRYYSAAMRHLLAWQKGEVFDRESDLHHMYHAACNLMFIAYYSLHGEAHDATNTPSCECDMVDA